MTADFKPEIILFQGTSHDVYWYNRAAGTYKLASHLQKQGFPTQVIPNCTALTLKGYEQVFRKYASKKLRWIGFTTNWLAGRKKPEYYVVWWNSDQLIVDTEMEQWYHVEVDDREQVYSCLYDQKMFYAIWNLAKEYFPDCQLVFGGSQLNRNEYFHQSYLMPEAHYIKGNAELSVITMSKRFRKKNFDISDVSFDNNDYDYGDFKNSFITYRETDHIESHEWLPIEISRGCAFKCHFCNYDMKGVTDNYVNPDQLRENIIRHHDKWGTTKFTIMDDLYNDNFKKVEELYEKCWSKLPFEPELGGYLRLDLLWKRPDQAELLYKSGFRCGSFGIETLHDKAGKAVGKGLGKKRILETLEMLKEVWGQRVLIHAFFIAGLPHEDQQSLLDTVNWTSETDLIHGIIWHWLELENVEILPKDTNVDKISIIGKNPRKYGYSWYDRGDKVYQIKELSLVKKLQDLEQISDEDERRWAMKSAEAEKQSTTWINNVGVDLDFAKRINKEGNQQRLNTYFTMYADKRALGQTHHQIMVETLTNAGESHYAWENDIKKPKTIERLLKIIT